MIKITLPIAIICWILVSSCAKDVTCDCEITHSDSGNEYSIKTTYDPVTYKPVYEQVVEPFADSYKTKETNLYSNRASKRTIKAMCPKEGEESYQYDNTVGNTKNDYITGRKGIEKTIRRCTID